MNWLDLIVLGILLINVGIGWFKGLIRSMTNLISIILGFIIAKIYYLNVYNYLIENYDLYNKIKLSISKNFNNIKFPENISTSDMSIEQLSKSTSESNYLQLIVESFFKSNNFKGLVEENITSYSEVFSSWLSEKILLIISMVIVFIVVFLSVRFIGYILDKIFKFPGLKGVNKLSGLAFGLAKGCFYGMLFILLITLVGPIFSKFNIIETLETSSIAIYFYKYNIIIYIFELII